MGKILFLQFKWIKWLPPNALILRDYDIDFFPIDFGIGNVAGGDFLKGPSK